MRNTMTAEDWVFAGQILAILGGEDTERVLRGLVRGSQDPKGAALLLCRGLSILQKAVTDEYFMSEENNSDE